MSNNDPKCRDTKRHIGLKEQEERLGRAMAKLAKQEREERKELRSMISFHERARSKENGSKGGRPKIGENSEQAKARRWHVVPLVFCPECNGDGYIEVEKVAPWIDRDTPPDLVSYKKVCEICLGEGKIIPEEKEDGN